MIKQNTEPLSMPEAAELIKKTKPEETEVIGFIKKFTKLKPENAQKMKHELKNLNLLKMKTEHIVKIIDLTPEDAEDLNKIFADASLDENETNKILELIKKFKK